MFEHASPTWHRSMAHFAGAIFYITSSLHPKEKLLYGEFTFENASAGMHLSSRNISFDVRDLTNKNHFSTEKRIFCFLYWVWIGVVWLFCRLLNHPWQIGKANNNPPAKLLADIKYQKKKWKMHFKFESNRIESKSELHASHYSFIDEWTSRMNEESQYNRFFFCLGLYACNECGKYPHFHVLQLISCASTD